MLSEENIIQSLVSCLHISGCCLYDWKQVAAVAALCVQYEAELRPNMSIVVKALQPLLGARKAVHPGEAAPRF